MIEYRRHQRGDIEQMISILENHLKETSYKKIRYSREKMSDLLHGNLSNSQFFTVLAIEDGKIIGGFAAGITSFFFSYEAMAQDYFFYVKPEKRSLKLATELVAKYLEWAKARKVSRVQLSNSMGVNVDTFAKLATKLGFTQSGTIHVMEI